MYEFRGGEVGDGLVFHWSKQVSDKKAVDVGVGKIVSVQLPPVDGEFFFLVQGAQAEDTESYKGGRGAILSGRLQLKGASLLHVLVGGK